jgi:predicted metalloprotease with PDZ domain
MPHSTPLRYRIAPLNRAEHTLNVTLQITPREAGDVLLRMPTWIPGSYLIREYARHVLRVQASINDTVLIVQKIDKATWKLADCAAGLSIKIVFEIYAFDFSVRGAALTSARLFFNGAAVFPEWVGHVGMIELDIENDGSDSNVATTLPALLTDERGFGRYRAADYDALLDHPVEISAHERLDFEVRGIPHALVVTGAYKADLARVVRDTQKVCAEHIAMFHATEAPPFKHYLFLLSVLPEGYGGLEHRDSTSLVCATADLPIAGDPAISEGYLSLLGLISHEYFHAWNVKRIRPKAFVPYDLTREALTSQLWVYEGFTSYYDDLALVRAGVITHDDYLRLMGRNITNLTRTPGRAMQTVAQSSFDAWVKYYRQDENTPNALVSYYLKGGLVAMLLDLALRAGSEKTLDDVMRALFNDWKSSGEHYVGTDENALANSLQALTGSDWQPWLNEFVFGLTPLPFEAALAKVGVKLFWRGASGAGDRGGLPERAPTLGTHPQALGIILVEGSERVKNVLHASAAARAGVSAQDVLVALDGVRAAGGGIANVLSRAKPGDTISLHVFREARLLALALSIPAVKSDTAWCTWDNSAGEDEKARAKAWLKG